MNKEKYISQLAECIDKLSNLSMVNGKNSNIFCRMKESHNIFNNYEIKLMLNTGTINRIALEVTGELIRFVNDIKNEKED